VLTIACVAVNNYCKRQAEYVNNLRLACKKQITVPFEFACITDNPLGFAPDIRVIPKPNAFGWWCKLFLFCPGVFRGRVLYLDLDSLLLANLDDLANYAGAFAGLGCARRNRIFSSGVMAWQAGECDFIWTEWLKAAQPILGNGDDEWIDKITQSRALRLQRQFGGFYQYKFHKCEAGPPKDARLIYFTRDPKPHEAARWAQLAWRSGGAVTYEPEPPKLTLTERLARKRAEKSL
jgi:hypothetical protein